MGAISAVGVMYWQFGPSDCKANLVVISLTLGLSIIVLVFQVLWNADYSILSSAIMMAYCTYLCYATVTLDSSPSCNPTLSTGYQTLQAAIGMTITTLSILWSTYSAGNHLRLCLCLCLVLCLYLHSCITSGNLS